MTFPLNNLAGGTSSFGYCFRALSPSPWDHARLLGCVQSRGQRKVTSLGLGRVRVSDIHPHPQSCPARRWVPGDTLVHSVSGPAASWGRCVKWLRVHQATHWMTSLSFKWWVASRHTSTSPSRAATHLLSCSSSKEEGEINFYSSILNSPLTEQTLQPLIRMTQSCTEGPGVGKGWTSEILIHFDHREAFRSRNCCLVEMCAGHLQFGHSALRTHLCTGRIFFQVLNRCILIPLFAFPTIRSLPTPKKPSQEDRRGRVINDRLYSREEVGLL